MAKLDDLITSDLSGESINTIHENGYVEFKQTFEVIPDYTNFTWKVKTKLYGRLKPGVDPSHGTILAKGVWTRMANERFTTSQRIEITNHIYINNNMVQDNPYNYYLFLSNEYTFQCSNTGRYGIVLRCGYINSNNGYSYFTNYRTVYLTLPAFSGIRYKTNEGWKLSMPFIKVNGEWKKALQYIKINGEWVKYKDSWKYQP